MGVTRGAMADVIQREPHLAFADVMDPSTNVQMGSRYLQLRLDTVYQGDVRRALAQYGEGLAYADGVIAARDALAGAPPIDTLRKTIYP